MEGQKFITGDGGKEDNYHRMIDNEQTTRWRIKQTNALAETTDKSNG